MTQEQAMKHAIDHKMPYVYPYTNSSYTGVNWTASWAWKPNAIKVSAEVPIVS